jgi:hypothetical protein
LVNDPIRKDRPMEKRKDTEAASDEPKAEVPKIELPDVESPSISPATPMVEPVAESPPAVEPTKVEKTDAAEASATIVTPLRFAVRVRYKDYAYLAASVTLAASLGAMVGVFAGSGGFRPETPRPAVAALEDQAAMQQTLGKLNKEIAALKSNLEAANKLAHSQIAKINERFDRASSEELITGSISPPQTVAPVPTPRPAPRVAAIEVQPPTRPSVVQGWSVRDSRDGFVYVQGNGDIYQVVPGAPLPGLGPVESIKRQDGRWVVTTPKGIIVSARDRRYFE